MSPIKMRLTRSIPLQGAASILPSLIYSRKTPLRQPGNRLSITRATFRRRYPLGSHSFSILDQCWIGIIPALALGPQFTEDQARRRQRMLALTVRQSQGPNSKVTGLLAGPGTQ